MDKRIKFTGIVIILYTVIFSAQAFAADLTPGQDPGVQAEQYKVEVDKEKQRLERKTAKAPEIKLEEEKTVAALRSL